MNNNHSGDRYLRSLGLRPAQDSDALAAQLRQAVGDAQAEAALSALYTRRTQQETATSGLDRQETAAFYDRKNQHPQASLILSAAHDWDLLCQTCQWVTQHPDAFGGTDLPPLPHHLHRPQRQRHPRRPAAGGAAGANQHHLPPHRPGNPAADGI